MAGPSILLTNDDGIDAPGIRSLHEDLVDVGDVTVVAPADDQSAVGRALSSDVTLHDHDLGYAIEGTPADCVVAGVEALSLDPDLVVAGCNRGANLGGYTLGRSGTVSAAVEAAFFGIPAIAVSLYVPVGEVPFSDVGIDEGHFDEATRAGAFLADTAPDAGVFDHADYLNVNAPLAEDEPLPMEITTPSHVYMMDATREGEAITLHDRIWEHMEAGDVPDPEGTDRRAVVEGRVSVSPLTAPHTTRRHEALDALAERYPSAE